MRPIDADALKDNMFYYAVPEMVWDRGDIEHKINEMPTIDAISVEWLREKIKEHTDEEGWQDYLANSFGLCIEEWQKEQEAR